MRIIAIDDGMGDLIIKCPAYNAEGIVDMDNKVVSFTWNLAPDSDANAEYSVAEMVDSLNNDIGYLNDLKRFVKALGDDGVRIVSDFYYSDGDLLIRVDVSFSHPIFLKIQNQLYAK